MWYSVTSMTEPSAPAGYGDSLQRSGKTVPLYVQVAQLLRQRIYRNNRQPGDMLAGETSLAAEWDVSLETVRKALAVLRAEGLIVTEHGVGSRIARMPSRVTVAARPGDVTESRMPTPAERRALDMPEGVPLVVLVHPDGGEEIYDGMRTRVTFT